MKIGFIGLGIMGLPMATNLIAAGFQIKLWNRSPLKSDIDESIQQNLVSTINEILDCDVIISMVADDKATLAIIENNNLYAHMKNQSIFLNMATVSVELAEALEDKFSQVNKFYVAAPVLGRFDAARDRTLSILTAGHSQAVLKVMPILEALGKRVLILGDHARQANVVKLSVNFMIANAIQAMSEAVCLAEGYGIEARKFVDVLGSTIFNIPVYQNYGRIIANRNYEPAGFKMHLGLKDIQLALDAAATENIALPSANVIKDNLLDAIAHGQAEQDWAAVVEVSRRKNHR